MMKPSTVALIGALSAFAGVAAAQSGGEGQEQTPPPQNVPQEGQPRAQEQLPEAPPEEVLKSPPPIEKNQAPATEPEKPAPPLPNTLPPAKKVEPRVPNT